ncbi:MAG: M1 family metallopeptidase [Phycisphaerales bacterium]|nr:M1 family metallopeptidase [Phycisphaerales bacterium]
MTQVGSLLLAISVLAGGAIAQRSGDPRIDESTGRDQRVWAPARRFDHERMVLEITIPDMNAPAWSAREELRVRAIGSPRADIRLDAGKDIRIGAVTVGGKPAAFIRGEDDVTVVFDEPVAPGAERAIVFEYELDYANGNTFGGLYWSAGRSADPDENKRWPQIHTQGQPEANHGWFIGHDFPNERLATEIIVDVEEGYQVLSNGRLATPEGGSPAGEGRRRWHWVQDQPHVNYLVTLVVGKFEIVDLGGPASARPGLPIRVWAPLGKGERCRAVFGETPAMIAYFEKLLDEPFPWDKYDQVVPREYTSGAMENTSASTFYIFAAGSSADAQRDIIAHELFHQWTGDLLTCKTWAHIWLNEGWASYGQALWREEWARQQGKDPREAYLDAINENMSAQRGNRGSAPGSPALVSNIYRDPFEVFMKLDNPYPKGALVLHMLREGLGDEAFFAGVRLYIDRYRLKEVETDDFRKCLEEASGQSLERFFDQWVYRPGLPRLNVGATWRADEGVLRVTVTQNQKLDADNPAYQFTLPIYVWYGENDGEWVDVRTDERTVTVDFPLRAAPADVSVDPDLTVAGVKRVEKSLAAATAGSPAMAGR